MGKRHLLGALTVCLVVIASLVVVAVDAVDGATQGPITESVVITASDAAPGDQLGTSIDMSGDTIVAGAGSVDNLTGAAYVFVRTATGWTEQAILRPSDTAGYPQFGDDAVAIDGDTIVVSAAFDDEHGVNAGAVYVFVRAGTAWTEQAKLTPPGQSASDVFGSAVALHGDFLLVGARADDTSLGIDSGSAHVFRRFGATWSHEAVLTASDGSASEQFGASVALSGTTAMVGVPADDVGSPGLNDGSVYVFERQAGGGWVETSKLLPPAPSSGGSFGRAVAIDGDVAVISSDGVFVPPSPRQGVAHVFRRTGGHWSEEVQIVPPNFGSDLQIIRDVDILDGRFVLAYPWDDANGVMTSGSGFVYQETASGWDDGALLLASDPAPIDVLGWDVALSSTGVVALSAMLADDAGDNAGAIYIYDTIAPLNVPPTVDAGGPYDGTEGAAIALSSATASDPDSDPFTLSWTVDAPSVCSFDDDTLLNPELTCDDGGTYAVTLTADDGTGPAVSDDATVSVTNVAPTATFGNDSPVDEGTSFNLDLSSPDDPSGADTAAGFTYAFDCGTGYTAFSEVATASCTTTDNSTLTVKGKIRDKDLDETEYADTVTVANVAPTISGVTGPAGPVEVGVLTAMTVSFTDPGSADTFDVTFDWGDNASSTQEDRPGSPVTDFHEWFSPGVYAVTVTVVDDDGGVDSAVFEFVVAFDPDGDAFITGGGHLIPDGDDGYPGDGNGKKTNFGFNARYEVGAPQGTLNAKLGDLHVKSLDIHWLVISTANVGTFQGTATIDDTDTMHPFRVTAYDGDVLGDDDTFTLQIWAAGANPFLTAPIHVLTGPLDGGKIQVHR